MPPEVTTTACARSSNSPVTSRFVRHTARLRGGSQDAAADADDGVAVGHQLVDAVAEPHGHLAGLDGGTDPAHERLQDAGTGPPGDVEARHRVAVPARPAVTALGPAHDREEPHPALTQPRPLLPGGEVDVGPRPAAAPVVLVVAVEPRRALPVLPRQLDAVAHAHPPLLGGVDEEQPAEGPERLPAEVDRRLLVDQQDALAGGHQLGRRRPGRRGPPRPRGHRCAPGDLRVDGRTAPQPIPATSPPGRGARRAAPAAPGGAAGRTSYDGRTMPDQPAPRRRTRASGQRWARRTAGLPRPDRRGVPRGCRGDQPGSPPRWRRPTTPRSCGSRPRRRSPRRSTAPPRSATST